jgi:ribosomal protein L30E
MAKKTKVESETIKVLREKVQEGKVIVGKDRVLKALKAKTLGTVFVAANCPEGIKEDIKHYAELAEIPFHELGLDNEELGIFCKKNYFVAVIGTVE